MITCPACGAVCREKKDETRFARRHPKKCAQHELFQRDLAAGTASVDYDEKFPAAEVELRSRGYALSNESRCRGCGIAIEWWTTPALKRMPMVVLEDGRRAPHWGDCPAAKRFRR